MDLRQGFLLLRPCAAVLIYLLTQRMRKAASWSKKQLCIGITGFLYIFSLLHELKMCYKKIISNL